MLHLVVPGLLWSKATISDATRELPLPALAMLLGRGRSQWKPTSSHPPAARLVSFEHWLCDYFSVCKPITSTLENPHSQDLDTPYGALRLLGETNAGDIQLKDQDAIWLCADPIHMRFSQDTLIAGSPSQLDLTQDEAAEFIATLNEHLSDIGEFSAPHPTRWYFRLNPANSDALQIIPVLTPLSTVTGRAVEAFLPDKTWRRILNDIQTILHNHPVNNARESSGRLVVNSLWPWGAGKLPTQGLSPLKIQPVFTNNPLVRGLARLTNTPCHAVEKTNATQATTGLIILDTLTNSAQTLDVVSWRESLLALEQDWFAPLLAQLKSGKLKQLKMTLSGDESWVDVNIQSNALWKFWRAPKPLSSFYLP